MEYTEEELRKKLKKDLRKICEELDIKDCLKSRVTNNAMIALILGYQKGKKASKSKKSPKRKQKKSPKRKPKKRTPKRKSPVKRGSEDDLKKKKVAELKKMCKELGIKECDTGKYIKKSELIRLIMDHRTKTTEKKVISPRKAPPKRKPKKKTPPKRKPKKKVPEREFKCYPNRTRKCKKGSKQPICFTKTGRCRKDTKALSKDLKSGVYHFDEQLELVGSKEDLDAYKEFLGMEDRAPRKGKCYDKEDYLECEPGEICWEDGTCRPTSERKEDQWVLKVEPRGYDIVGSKKHIHKLQKELGGDIIGPEEEEIVTIRPPKEKGKEKVKRKPPRKPSARKPPKRKPPRGKKEPPALSKAREDEIIATFMKCLEGKAV